jgi:Multiple myeloma tumor-associated
MDLLTTVRKEGSRGGRGDFKWSDVQSSTHRENYLGHSLMAPVGRWQKGRDLNWYAKGDADEEGGETAAEKAERERKEEIKRIKEAEQDALARALGYDVPPRNPNLESLGDRKEVDKILREAAEDEDAEVGKGVGYGKFGINHGEADERILGSYESTPNRGLAGLRKEDDDRLRHKRRRSRSRSRHRDSHRRRRHRDEDDNRRRSRSRSRERTRGRRSRSRDRKHREQCERRRNRSRSPCYKDRDGRRGNQYERRR